MRFFTRGARAFVAVVLLTGLLAACGSDGGSEKAAEATDDGATNQTVVDASPVRIGVLNPTTGPYAQLGKEVNDGIKAYFEAQGNKVGGHPIELIFEDTTGDGAIALDKARKVIDQDKVQLIMGTISSAEALAIKPLVDGRKIPFILTNASANTLTAEAGSDSIFRTSYTSYQKEAVGGWYVAEKLGYKDVVLVAYDYVAGREHADGFKKTYEAAGGKIRKEIYVPLGTTDVGSYLSQVEAEIDGGADAVVTLLWAPTSIPWLKEWSNFGLDGKAPIVGVGDLADETVLPAVGPAIKGFIGWRFYVPTADNPENQAFVKTIKAAIGTDPTTYTYQGWVGAQAVGTALGVGGIDTFTTELQKVTFTTPAGYEFRFDDKHNVVFTTFIHRTEAGADGKMTNKIIDQIEDTDQFWKSPG